MKSNKNESFGKQKKYQAGFKYNLFSNQNAWKTSEILNTEAKQLCIGTVARFWKGPRYYENYWLNKKDLKNSSNASKLIWKWNKYERLSQLIRFILETSAYARKKATWKNFATEQERMNKFMNITIKKQMPVVNRSQKSLRCTSETQMQSEALQSWQNTPLLFSDSSEQP